MSIKDLRDINWEMVTIGDLIDAHNRKGMCFEVNNGKIELSDIFINEEELDR